jgi:hypothetical protein
MHIGTKSGAFRGAGNGDAGLVDEFLRKAPGTLASGIWTVTGTTAGVDD